MAKATMLGVALIGACMPVLATAQECETDWFGLGTSLKPLSTVVPVVLSLETMDLDGAGPMPELLYAGGAFSGDPVLGNEGILLGHAIRQWDGASWQVLGEDLGPGDGGIGPRVYGLSVVDHDGAGPAAPVLYASGWLTTAEDPEGWNVAAWDGKSWSSPGGGILGGVFPYVVFDSTTYDADGAGPGGGVLVTAGRAGIVSFDGSEWTTLIDDGDTWYQVATFDDDNDPSTPALIAAGHARGVSVWDGQSWIDFGGPSFGGIGDALVSYDADGDGPGVSRLIAKGLVLEGGVWTPLVGIDGVSVTGFKSIAVILEESQATPVLYGARERDNDLHRWDGNVWSSIPAFSNPTSSLYYTDPIAMIGISSDSPVYPSGIYVGGIFEEVGGQLAHSVGLMACDRPGRACLGDTTADLQVTMRDLTAVLRDWGTSQPATDLNESGRVEFGDILGVLTTWGNDCRPSAAGTSEFLEGISDLNDDGVITFADSTAQLANWTP